MSAISMLMQNIEETSFGTLPAEVVEATKKQILDTLGVVVAGTMSGNVRQVVELVKDWGGKGESTILGYGGKVPGPHAALVNGYSAVVLDYDDFHDLDIIHASRAVLPACLATAERLGAVQGKDFILAVALGFDLACRLSRSALVHLEFGFDMCVANPFGAAAGAGKLLGLDRKKLTNALGIALMQLGGAGSGVQEATSTKGLDGGLQAKVGVIAALMAERGLTAVSDPIEGNRGFYQAYHRTVYRPELLTLDLGKVFEGATNSQKPYPCCRWIHTSIDAALALVNEYDIQPEEVEEVTVYIGPFLIQSAVHKGPLEIKQRPRNAIESQFSIPWAVANAILYRKVGIENFTEEALRNTRTIEMARRVMSKAVIAAPTDFRTPESVTVEIKTKRDKVYSKRVDYALGSVANPMSFDDVAVKFKECCNHSVRPVALENREQVIRMVKHLEEVTDVSKIPGLLV